MSHDFVDQMLEKTQAGELRSPVSETLEMHLVAFSRGEAVYEMSAREELGNPLASFDPQSYIAERGKSDE